MTGKARNALATSIVLLSASAAQSLECISETKASECGETTFGCSQMGSSAKAVGKMGGISIRTKLVDRSPASGFDQQIVFELYDEATGRKIHLSANFLCR